MNVALGQAGVLLLAIMRVIQKHIVNMLSKQILEGEFLEGDTIEVVLDRHGLIEFNKDITVKAAK